jgi:hypothetical protein
MSAEQNYKWWAFSRKDYVSLLTETLYPTITEMLFKRKTTRLRSFVAPFSGVSKMPCTSSIHFQSRLVQTRLYRKFRHLQQELDHVNAEIRDLRCRLSGHACPKKPDIHETRWCRNLMKRCGCMK